MNRKLYFPIILRQPSPHIWISIGELSQLPASGPAWNNLKERADEVADTPNLGDQDNEVNITILAKALVFARTGQAGYRSDVVAALRVIATHNTENSDSNPMLSVSRQLVAYVISADLVSLPEYDPSLDAQFRAKLRELLTENFDSDPGDVDTLQTMHERRPNNWGTHAGASRAALAIYLGDAAELERTAQVFKGWLGDRSAYAGFHFNDDLSWQADPNNPVAVNPLGAVIQGFPVDGAMPDEMRRGCSFQWPPCYTHYAWGGLQGAVVQAEILSRAGYPVWQWQDSAMLRAVQFLYLINWPATDDDQW
ncbi:MAG: alginate lyase family protein, partial [Anaerolineales bacterium]